MHTDGVDSTDAVDLNKVASHARHHSPDVDEGEDGKEDAPYESERDADQGRQQPVAPVFGYCEGCEAGFPYAVKAVGAGRFCDHILKVHLNHIVI